MSRGDLTGQKVLVVDDEEVFAQALADGLSTEFRGLEVLLARDGIAALEVLDQTAVDLVITDVSMPRLDGMGLVAEMISRRIRVPVVVATAFGTWEIERDARAHGVACVMDKPIDFARLVEIVAAELNPKARGALEGITLPGFLQLLESEKRSCELQVFCDGREAVIGLDHGQLVYCELADQFGLDALCIVLNWEGARIKMEKLGLYGPTAHPQSPIALGAALLESARRSDESQHALDRAALEDDGALDGLFALDDDAEAEAPVAGDPVCPPPPRVKHERSSTPTPSANGGGPRRPQPADASRRSKRDADMSNINEVTHAAMDLEGAVAFAIVDYESGMCLGSKATENFPIEVAAAGNKEVVKAKLRVMRDLGIGGGIEDILITLGTQYHLVRPLESGTLFLYLAIDRSRGNLALARHRLSQVESKLEI